MRLTTGVRSTLALVAIVAGTSACDPPPPRLPLTVDSPGTERDAEPGDGVCATDAGTCTLPAAIDEANAGGRVDLSVPPGTYDLDGETVTGAIWINEGEPDVGVRLSGTVTVAQGGALVLDGALGIAALEGTGPPLQFRADGLLSLSNVQLAWSGPATGSLVHVGPTGAALIDTSFVGASFATTSVVVNEGKLWLRFAWVMNIVPGDGAYAVLTQGSGVTTTGASAIAPQGTFSLPNLPFRGCGGTAPVSSGYNAFGDTSCGLTGEGDRLLDVIPISGTSTNGGVDYELTPESNLVDAVPIGVHGCGTTPWGDWYGKPRLADGNADEEPACDIGPKELQPHDDLPPFPFDRTAPDATALWGLG